MPSRHALAIRKHISIFGLFHRECPEPVRSLRKAHPNACSKPEFSSHDWPETVATSPEVIKAFLRCVLSARIILKVEISRIESHALEYIEFEAFHVDLDVFGLFNSAPIVARSNRYIERMCPGEVFVIWRFLHPLDARFHKRTGTGVLNK